MGYSIDPLTGAPAIGKAKARAMKAAAVVPLAPIKAATPRRECPPLPFSMGTMLRNAARRGRRRRAKAA